MNDFNYDNEIIEVSENTSTLEDLIREEAETGSVKPPKKKKSLKDKIKDLSKKQKITLIVIGILVLLMIIGIVLFFVLNKDEEEIKPQEVVIVEKDNYRYENGKLIFLDSNEEEIGSYECADKDLEKCYVAKINLENDTFDRVKSVYENGEELEKNSKIYYDNYVFVYDEEKITLYSIDTKEKELDLKSIKSYDTEDNLIVVEDEDNKYGVLEVKNDGYEYVIRPSYDNLGIVNSEKKLLLAQDKDDYYLINIDGKKISKNINAEVRSANENYIVGKINNTYNLYSYDYEELLSDYDYISIHDNVIALVKSNRLYLVDENLSKLYEEGIRLESSEYNKKYVYNDDNRLVKTLKSYEIEVNNNIASIIIGNSTTEVNILEGKVSSDFAYSSYFDGKLYFYSDEEKTDILGTYNCNNKNKVESAEDGLESCNLYNNETGISGIYNNEYVIIQEKGAENIYYLYNLKEKKVKGTYSDIQITSSSELNENIKPIYTSGSYIIAKATSGSNKGNYGVLEINSDKVQGKVGFKYESITKEKKYYKLISVDKTYSIYDEKFNKISNEFSYLELFDNYYVGINNNKLNVFSYTSQLEILNEGLSVNDNKFEIDFTNGFNITINGIKTSYDKNGKKVTNDNNEGNVNSEQEVTTETEGENNGE